MISNVEGGVIHNQEAEHACPEEDVVGEHGGGSAHEHVGECSAGVGGEG